MEQDKQMNYLHIQYLIRIFKNYWEIQKVEQKLLWAYKKQDYKMMNSMMKLIKILFNKFKIKKNGIKFLIVKKEIYLVFVRVEKNLKSAVIGKN